MPVIAIVDDSEAVLNSLRYTLEENGYEVESYKDGIEALNGLKSGNKQVDMVITDFNMPNANGIELTKRLRQLPNYKETPIVMLTTESQKSKMEAGKAVGLTGWIVKPFQPEKIIQTVKQLIG